MGCFDPETFRHLKHWFVFNWVQSSFRPSMTFDRGLLSSSFAAQLQESKLALSLTVLQPQCRNTFGSLSVADCLELFMVSLSVRIPRRGKEL